jgi:hypothetical protein
LIRRGICQKTEGARKSRNLNRLRGLRVYISNKKASFSTSEDGIRALDALTRMSEDAAYNTPDSYSANTELYPNNVIPFVDKHMAYLRDHANTDPRQYISNLRLMTKKGSR